MNLENHYVPIQDVFIEIAITAAAAMKDSHKIYQVQKQVHAQMKSNKKKQLTSNISVDKNHKY